MKNSSKWELRTPHYALSVKSKMIVYIVEHMLIECTISKELWRETRNWIVERVPDYLLTEDKIIMGELEKSICINSTLLLTKR